MTDKTWTATDLGLGPLKVHRDGAVVHIERRYMFLDVGGEVLNAVAGGRFVADIPIADLPGEILDALQAIDAWTKNQALIQEGMSDE